MTDLTLAWGGWRITGSDETRTPEDLCHFLLQLQNLGIDWIDLADIYDDGACETLIGQAMALEPGLHQHFKITTKCGVRFPSPGQPGVTVAHYRSDPEYIRSSLDASLNRLQIDQVSTLLLHRPDYLMNASDTGKALDELVRSGRIEAAGVSNFTVSQMSLLQAAMASRLTINQIEFSVLHSDPLDDGTLEYAQQQDQTIMAWSPLAQGRLFDQDTTARRIRSGLEAVIQSDDPDQIAGAALAWVGYHSSKPVVILGTTRIERLKAQVDTARQTRFDPQSWYQILELARGHKVP